MLTMRSQNRSLVAAARSDSVSTFVFAERSLRRDSRRRARGSRGPNAPTVARNRRWSGTPDTYTMKEGRYVRFLAAEIRATLPSRNNRAATSPASAGLFVAYEIASLPLLLRRVAIVPSVAHR